MKALETVRQQLAIAVRVDDHFTREAVREELSIALDSGNLPLRAPGGGTRHADGTYRFLTPVPAGNRTIAVAGAERFTWDASTSVTLPLADPSNPLVIEAFPAANARVPAGTLAIRGRLVAATPPVGQEVRIEVAGMAPRNRRTRCDDEGEFLFPLWGPMALDADRRVPLVVTVPTRTVSAIDLDDGGALSTSLGANVAVPPGREVRALIHLT